MNGIVISGATGTIGIALLEKCIKENIPALVLSHRKSIRNKYIPKSPLITVCECDLNEMENFEINLDGVYDTFYHFAWIGGYLRNDVSVQTLNIKYTLDAVKLAARLGCKTFIGAGSQAEYGITNQKMNGKTPTFPVTAFGATKLYAGNISRILAHQLGIRHIWARILSIYGPYDGERTMIMSTIIKLLNKEYPQFTNFHFSYSTAVVFTAISELF